MTNTVTVQSTSVSITITNPSGVETVVYASSPSIVDVMQPGVPSGGALDDILVKASATSFHTRWTDKPKLDAISFDLLAGESVAAGELAWNSDEGTVDLGNLNGVVNQLGQETVLLCRNSTGSRIEDGTAVMFAGTLGNSGRILVAPMVANGSYPGYVFFGIATHNINAGTDGYITVFGKVRGVSTVGWNDGDVLWCDPAVPGGLTKVEPHAPNLKLPVAAVISGGKNNGVIMVRADTGRRLMDLHDVEANGTKDDYDILHWRSTENRWEPTDRLTLLEQRVTALEGGGG
jgi:hypothetical protein